MLNDEARKKAEVFLEILKNSKEENRTPMFSVYELEWLAETLIEVDNRCKEHQHSVCNPHKESLKEEPTNYLTIDGEIVAIWRDTFYMCTFCDANFNSEEIALDHARSHLREII